MQLNSNLDFEEFNLSDCDEIDGDLENSLAAPLTNTGMERTDSWGRLFDRLGYQYGSSDGVPRMNDECGFCSLSPPPSPPMKAEDPHLGRVVVVHEESKPNVQDHPLEVNQVELQLDYLRTLKKLAMSMRRSDETRSIVKRQRGDDKNNFFMTPRWNELEQNRSMIFKVIQLDSSTRTVF
jgi:hypothetical protein